MKESRTSLALHSLGGSEEQHMNAAYLAACSPDTILELLDLIEDHEDGTAMREAWAEGYETCLGDFDIAARREARSPNPHE